MARFSPRVLPDPGPNFQTTLAQAMAAIDAKRQRDRQDTFDRVNLHRAGYHIGEEQPTTQVYEPDFTGTTFDPARPQTPATLPNPFTGRPTTTRDPLRSAWDARAPKPAFQVGSVNLADALGAVPLGGRGGPQEPRLKALPGAFVPETGTFADRPLFDQPAIPFQFGAGRMVARPDMSFERVGDGLWFSEEKSEAGRQRAYNERLADAERLNQQAAAEVERNRLADALGGIESLTPQQRAAIAAGVPLNVATYQPGLSEEDRMRLAHDYRMEEIAAQNKWRMGDPNDPDGASATSRLNRYAQAVKSVSDALQRYQASVLRDTFEPATPEMLENFLRNTFNIGLDEYYAMQGELFKLWGVGGSEAAQPPQAIQNPFLVPNPLADMGGTGAGSVLGDALRRAAAGGGAQVGPTREAAAALDTRQAITADQADYLRVVQGWTDDQINARYRVQ